MNAVSNSLERLPSSRFGGLLLKLVFITYGISLVGYFLFPDYGEHYRFFVRFVFFPGVFFIVAGYIKLIGNRLFQLVLVYLLFMVANSLWHQPFDLYKFGQMAVTSVYITGFIVLTHYFHLKFPTGFDRLLKTSVIIVAISIPIALISWYSDHKFPSHRADGIGSLTNVNEFANVYGVFALLAAGWALKASSIYEKPVFIFVVTLVVAFMGFGQSRTALAAFIVALTMLAINDSRQHKMLIGFAVVIPLALFLAAFPDVIAGALARGAHWRPLIWEEVWSQIITAPIFGHGLVVSEDFSVPGSSGYTTAHNAYLQALWHGGIIGFGLLIALLTQAFRGAWVVGRETGNYVLFSLFIFVSLCMMTGVDALIGRPRDQWMLFWFPLALLISYQLDRNEIDTGGG